MVECSRLVLCSPSSAGRGLGPGSWLLSGSVFVAGGEEASGKVSVVGSCVTGSVGLRARSRTLTVVSTPDGRRT